MNQYVSTNVNVLYMILIALMVTVVLAPLQAFAITDALIIFPETPEAAKYVAAGIAFGLGAIAAGWAVGRAGAAGLAATAERPEAKTTAIIITALGEALAIYGLVVALLLIG